MPGALPDPDADLAWPKPEFAGPHTVPARPFADLPDLDLNPLSPARSGAVAGAHTTLPVTG